MTEMDEDAFLSEFRKAMADDSDCGYPGADTWPPPDELAANGVDPSILLPSVLPDPAEIERWAGLDLTPAQASVRFYAAADALRRALVNADRTER